MATSEKEPYAVALNKILMPTDFSDHSQAALPYALGLAKRYGAELHLMTVVDMRNFESAENLAVGSFMQATIEEANKSLKELLPPERRDGVTVEVVAVVGIPFVEIIEYAADKKIDLVVIATHGRSGLGHALMGSVAEKVVRKAPCPVLTVRASAPPAD